MTEYTTSDEIGPVDTSVADDPTLIDGSLGSVRHIADRAVNHRGFDALLGIQCSTALATTLLTGLFLSPLAVRAACSQDDGVYTCSGSDIPPVVDISAEKDLTAILYEQVTGNFGPASSSDGGFAVTFHDYAADGTDGADDEKHEDGAYGNGMVHPAPPTHPERAQ
ncbi:hypothetical protein U5801_16845 [Lamprobacter modestohalophilus]|uniref:hypothetical protein n=1 Tax=Lamprobacter modestohalophilus TaxID=1064514 RepID=UPI002ADEE6CE|nr:hypothetical protein [Lamprobacter modestohalophilus]MEA1051460.1 hypothetical protein [Lamprobacter modestohalophilus]